MTRRTDHRRAHAATIVGLLGLSGCSSATLEVPPAWPKDRVLTVVETEGGASVRAHVYGPGEAIILSAPDGQAVGLAVTIYPPTEEAAIDPVRCGVIPGGDNPIVLAPEAAFVAPPADWSSGESPAFRKVATDSEELPKISYEGCVTDRFDCSQLDFEVFEADALDADVKSLVVPTDELIFFGTDTGSGVGPGAFDLYRAEVPGELGLQRQTQVVAANQPDTRARSLAFDGAQILGRTRNGQAFSVSLDGALTMTGLDPRYSEVTQGSGLVFEFGDGGLRQIGGTITTSIAAIYSVAVIGPDNIFATSDIGILHFDGRGWNVEETQYRGEGWRVGGDRDVAVVTGDDGTIVERDAVSGQWRYYGKPFGTFSDPRVAIGLGQGRWMIGAQDSGLKVKLTTGRLCSLPTIGGNNYEVGAVSPSGKTIFMGLSELGSITGDHAPLVRLRLP